MIEDLDAYWDAYTPEFPYHGDEELLLRAYADKIVAHLQSRRGLKVLSLGIGGQRVSTTLRRQLDIREYHIVEGSGEIIKAYRATAPEPWVSIHHARFETAELPAGGFDAVEMGFVLEHVDDPAWLLRRFRAFLKPGGLLFAAVPNARSLHRLLGHAAGMLPDIYSLSESDRALGHKRYFDSCAFESLVSDAGYAITHRFGLVLKPLTTSQLASLSLPQQVERAFIEVGYPLHDICNGVMLVAEPA